jgi:hypothetical protein
MKLYQSTELTDCCQVPTLLDSMSRSEVDRWHLEHGVCTDPFTTQANLWRKSYGGYATFGQGYRISPIRAVGLFLVRLLLSVTHKCLASHSDQARSDKPEVHQYSE